MTKKRSPITVRYLLVSKLEQFLQPYTIAVSKQTSNPDPLEDHASKYISVLRAAEISGFTPGYIRRLLRNKVIEGKKIGRDWFMTEEALREYLAKERRPGPDPRKN